MRWLELTKTYSSRDQLRSRSFASFDFSYICKISAIRAQTPPIPYLVSYRLDTLTLDSAMPAYRRDAG